MRKGLAARGFETREIRALEFDLEGDPPRVRFPATPAISCLGRATKPSHV